MLGSEAALNIMAFTTVALCVIGLVAGFFGMRRSWRRLGVYVEPGASRAYALQQLALTVARWIKTVLFLITGAVLSFMPDSDLRSGIARLLVLGVVVILVSIQVFDPIVQSRVEYLRYQEKEKEKEDGT